MNLPYDTVRCTGKYELIKNEFGRVMNLQCVGCQRRIAGYPPGHWYFDKVPVFEGACPQRLGDAT